MKEDKIEILKNKIDFAVVLTVDKANPNGDPNSGNCPRIDLDGFGEMSDVCIKRKIRNRLQDFGLEIFVQTQDRSEDGFLSLKSRARAYEPLHKALSKKGDADLDLCTKLASEKWADVRFFGQVFSMYKNTTAASFGIRGPVSITMARSLEYVNIIDSARTTSQNLTKDTIEKENNTFYTKQFVDKGAYVFYGGVFPQLAKKTGFSTADAELLKECLLTLLENDVSAARPIGSMTVASVYWWEQEPTPGRKQQPPIALYRSLNLTARKEYPYFTADIADVGGLTPDVVTLF